MKEKILPHQKIRITRKKILKLGACLDGANAVKALLPVTISTNPDGNIALAKKVIENCVEHYVTWPWEKLAANSMAMWNEISDIDRLASSRPEGDLVGWGYQMDTLPQVFAAMADSLLRHKKFRPVGARK